MRYMLGRKFNGTYFSQREAECMAHFLLNKGNNETAQCLRLSPKTIEFYTANMRVKLRCGTKAELIEKVKTSDFPHFVYSIMWYCNRC